MGNQPSHHGGPNLQERIRADNERKRKEQEEAAKKERADQEEKRRREEREKEERRMAAEERRIQLEAEKELEDRKLQLQHEEEMRKLANQEKVEEQKTSLAELQTKLEHERLMTSQDKVLSIIGNLFQKVEAATMPEVAFGATILQSIQAGKPVDKDVLKAVTGKVANPPSPNIRQIVDNVLRSMPMDEDEEDETSFREGSRIPRSRSQDLMEDVE